MSIAAQLISLAGIYGVVEFQSGAAGFVNLCIDIGEDRLFATLQLEIFAAYCLPATVREVISRHKSFFATVREQNFMEQFLAAKVGEGYLFACYLFYFL